MFIIGGNQPQAEFTPAAMQRCEEFATGRAHEQRREHQRRAATRATARRVVLRVAHRGVGQRVERKGKRPPRRAERPARELPRIDEQRDAEHQGEGKEQLEEAASG